MKVNIIGKGVIPYVNRVAPVYNTEVNAEILKKLVRNPKYKIYGSDGSGQVTAATFNPPIPTAPPVVEEKVTEEAPKSKKTSKKSKKVEEVAGVVTDIVVEEKVDVVEETLPEITEENVTEEKVAEPTPVAEVEELEIPIEETDVEAFPAEEEVTDEEEESVEESSDEVAPKQTSKKKKKNRR